MSMNERTGRPQRWIRHSAVAAHLRLDRRTLRALMNRTPGAVHRPWIDMGLGGLPRYRWESIDAAEQWYRATCESINPQSADDHGAGA